ncbi:hypothetical protein [Holospora curviuscula]|uniref:Uncharacterized protein n=1 Tax=Holospora curviuscula TaxID=1082868 RepID=A0A2S5R6R9_9PROT|nr:hypothetical protein [Holospora curviuscula]PPE03026.1 hypothetical protein HCUR_01536 [Holospora curviuscula]
MKILKLTYLMIFGLSVLNTNSWGIPQNQKEHQGIEEQDQQLTPVQQELLKQAQESFEDLVYFRGLHSMPIYMHSGEIYDRAERVLTILAQTMMLARALAPYSDSVTPEGKKEISTTILQAAFEERKAVVSRDERDYFRSLDITHTRLEESRIALKKLASGFGAIPETIDITPSMNFLHTLYRSNIFLMDQVAATCQANSVVSENAIIDLFNYAFAQKPPFKNSVLKQDPLPQGVQDPFVVRRKKFGAQIVRIRIRKGLQSFANRANFANKNLFKPKEDSSSISNKEILMHHKRLVGLLLRNEFTELKKIPLVDNIASELVDCWFHGREKVAQAYRVLQSLFCPIINRSTMLLPMHEAIQNMLVSGQNTRDETNKAKIKQYLTDWTQQF